MASLFSANVANPFAQALIPHVPAEALAVAAGALVGVALFAMTVVLFSRRKPRRRPPFEGTAVDIAFVSSFGVVPPVVLQHRNGAEPYPPPRVFAPSASRRPFAADFRPSTALSGRAFAKMGFAFGERVDAAPTGEELASNEPSAIDAPAVPVAADSIPIPCELESMPSLSSVSALETGPMAAVTVQPIIPIGECSIPSREESSPSPLAIIRRSSSSMPAMQVHHAAPIGELDFDDGPTQLGEPPFDVAADLRAGS